MQVGTRSVQAVRGRRAPGREGGKKGAEEGRGGVCCRGSGLLGLGRVGRVEGCGRAGGRAGCTDERCRRRVY